MALENLKTVFNNIYENDARSVDDLPSPSINTIGGDHSYGSDNKFDSINQVLQPDGTYKPYGSIPIAVSSENSPMSKKLMLSEQEPSLNYSGYENQNGVKIKDVDGVEKLYEGLLAKGDTDNDSIRFRHFNGANIGVDNALGVKGSSLTLESIFDPTHGAGSQLRPSGVGSTKYLDIKASGDTLTGFSEPFIVNPIPNSGKNSIKAGYSRDFLPYNAAADDLARFRKFYTTPRGLQQLFKENVTNAAIGDSEFLNIPPNPFASIMAPPVPIPNTGFLNFYQQTSQELGSTIASLRKPFKIEYSRKVDLGLPFAVQGDNTFGIEQIQKINIPEGKTIPGKLISKGLKKLKQIGILKLQKAAQIPTVGTPTSFINNTNDVVGNKLSNDDVDRKTFETTELKKGDFYVRIKDLRNNENIYFRGFVTGINENVTPSFSPTQYIGRSEDVYVYQKAERDLSFNLKVYPKNEAEFNAQYDKINHLTSLAYPSYFPENGFSRMQAPFTELYMAHIGTQKEGQFGFIKSLTYTIPESGDWDAYSSLPRMFEIAMSYQILNRRPPQLGMKFYKGHGEMIGE